mgnify:CR=1 FL=1
MIDITTRSGKGAPLTTAELDDNFLVLRDAILAGISGIFIREITQDAAGLVTFEFSDGSTQGPITLPRQPVRFRGAYAAGQIYEVGDLVHSPATVFIVTEDHVGLATEQAIAGGQIRSLSGIPDAPVDGGRYVREAGQWTELVEPAPAWGMPTDYDGSLAYPRFAVVAAEIAPEVEGDPPVEHLFVAMTAIEAGGAAPGVEGSGWRRMTV